MTIHQQKISDERLTTELWRRGVLLRKYHSGQLDLNSIVKRIIAEKKTRKVSFRTTRRFGKTYFLSCFAIEECLKHKNINVPYTTTTVSALKKIVLPVFNQILVDCPKDLRPKFSRQDNTFYFKTGSTIPLFGTDNGNAERARGIKAKHCLFDEAGFIDDLEYIINSIFVPTMTYDTGIIIAASTPPPESDHYFNDYHLGCETNNAAIVKTVWDNPLIRIDEILQLAEAVGCKVDYVNKCILEKTVTFEREFEAKLAVDPKRKIIPEFTDDTEKDFVKEIKLPEYSNKYTVIDFGFKDKTGVTFGFYDFNRAKACVNLDLKFDFMETGNTLKVLSDKILEIEKTIFGEHRPVRYADGDLIVLQELSSYGCYVAPVIKDDLEAQVNQIRTDAIQKRFEISPNAVHTIRELKHGVWNKRRTDFQRTEGLGHLDNLASFMYFLRHIDRQSNPYPKDYKFNYHEQYKSQPFEGHELTKIFNFRK